MDTLLSTGRVAEMLGTTRSRVHRAVAVGIVHPTATAGGHLRFTTDEVAVLERQLGYAPAVDDLTREEVLVATALLRRPLGLRSARAVARAAGVSPTTASRALRRLEAMELVRRGRRRVVLGVPTDVDVWEIEVRNPRWSRLAPVLADAVLPEPSQPQMQDRRVPVWLRHLFWNVDIHRLDVARDAAYLAGRILFSEDAQAHAWGAANLPAHGFAAASQIRGVPPERVALARNLAAAG
jgi:DNA-binding transcriptional ArsR family regulator